MKNMITPKALNNLRKKYNLPPNSPISSKQYNELLSNTTRKKRVFTFGFDYSIKLIEPLLLEITLVGMHLSKNVYASLPEFDNKNKSSKHHYRKSFKTSSQACYLLQNKLFKELKERGAIPAKKATVEYVFYNKRSRDHDNNSETIKRVQDTFTTLGIIEDDSRDILSESSAPKEVILSKGEPYKMVCYLRLE